ncbi:tRNA(Phe) (4-demethylwyosine(37)-C(7)) aminocarboxypropyltransferase [Aspergillus saccharolyticus JOP 1030-1]|uniref:tRNA wybutosine-synthesizing protein 2 n=1 Tax=Aspergillus saccharolyticus JOP 1030-1 TaxID=1450539 RepID=A0A318ZE13_9EURO|nr:putative methyltransferase [Aspergillus saccharolyticus JOP 1030-1]PYH44524.1 putative methyltransferase [Aspergillus saccharolyticus JOP 1030-1]
MHRCIENYLPSCGIESIMQPNIKAPEQEATPSHPADTPVISSPRLQRKPKKQTLNPLHHSIQAFITQHLPPDTLAKHNLTLTSLPKRFTIYEPLLLLPVNALTTPPAWHSLYQELTAAQRQTLFATLLQSFSRYGLTHVAMNAPIALTDPNSGAENRIRSPGGLIPLYGDFGPMPPASPSFACPAKVEAEGEAALACPTSRDLEQAFWVRTVQNHGIVQIWAPLYTMFSRGNITEKARILGNGFEGLDERQLGEYVSGTSVVDMYAGIGYFVFSYLKRGVKRVWGFEINGWSVEGLRRGCMENGWGCKVFRVGEDGSLLGGHSLREVVERLTEEDRVVVFHGDNRFAAQILGEIRESMRPGEWNRVRHVNLGLLPSSCFAYENACRIVDGEMGGWVHVHENVNVQAIEAKRDHVTAELGKLREKVLGVKPQSTTTAAAAAAAECRHVEQVKTYAPGVMHCVFDVRLSSSEETKASTA